MWRSIWDWNAKNSANLYLKSSFRSGEGCRLDELFLYFIRLAKNQQSVVELALEPT
jgi:hypothetical protein